MLSVAEFAEASGLSVARARRLASSGQVRAEKVGAQWAIPEREVLRWKALPSRPMVERVAWAAGVMADGGRAEWLESSERSRLRRRLASLERSEDPAGQVAAWMQNRGAQQRWHADADSLKVIARRVRLSGVSSPLSGLSSGGLVEGYVSARDLDPLVEEFWLVPGGPDEGELMLRVSDFSLDRIPRLVVAADLFAHRRAREVGAAERLVRDVMEQALW